MSYTLVLLKDKSTQKFKYMQYLLASWLVESRAKFLSPQNRIAEF